MSIYLGTQSVIPSGLDKVYLCDQLIYESTPSTLYLYNEGDECISVTGGWTGYAGDGTHTVVIGTASYAGFFTNNDISNYVSNYSNLKIECTAQGNNSGHIGYGTNVTIPPSSQTDYTDIGTLTVNTTRHVETFTLQSFYGHLVLNTYGGIDSNRKYIKNTDNLYFQHNTSRIYRIYKVWLE